MEDIYKLYDVIYKKYIFLNSFITLGLDKYWRKKCVGRIYSINSSPEHILDICAGTGDMSVLLEKQFPISKIYALDANENMLSIARKRLERTELIKSMVSNIPFDDNYFDIVVISFAARNIFFSSSFNNSLAEIKRVIKKDGFFISVETTNYNSRAMNLLMSLYVGAMIGIVNFLNKDCTKSYNFLKSSAIGFNASAFTEKLKFFFTDVKTIKLFPGCSCIHISKK
jgi:ubiquinone/menaquinone biosynthesis methyltransferase